MPAARPPVYGRPLIGAFLLLVNAGSTMAAGAPPAAAVASAHPIATDAGVEILKAGGNAFDAAVAVSATLAVVEPYSSGLGGGGFWLLHRATDGRDLMIDGRERAPGAATETLFQDADGNVVPDLSVNGALAAGIPGEPAALVWLAEHYGRLPLRQSLAPAIRAARDGFAVDAYYQRMVGFRRDVLRRYPGSAAVLLKDGDVPPPGYAVKQPGLARTLEALAEHGRDGFYAGPVATQLVDAVRAAGGRWTLADLANYRVVEREPLKFRYRDLNIVSAPPPSSGGVALATMLNILSGYKLDGLDTASRVHLIVEAMRRAYRDRAQYLGDPDQVEIPVALLTSPEYAAGLRASIRSDQATPSAALPGLAGVAESHHTSHFSIIDGDGNRVAATMSINYPFGSCLLEPETGILLNDEMDDFSAKPGVPNVYGLVGGEANAIAPGKRPLSSMSPTFVENGRGVAILGTPGGSRIISMVLLGLLAYDDGGLPEDWVARPRFHHQYLPDEIQYESGALTPEEIGTLRARGHKLTETQPYGNMQAVFWDRQAGRVYAASDPRGVGSARVLDTGTAAQTVKSDSTTKVTKDTRETFTAIHR